MRLAPAVLGVCLAVFANTAFAQKLPYARATIAEWKGEFSSMVAENMEKFMLPNLLGPDHAKASRVRFIYEDRSDVQCLNFRTDGKNIYMPVTGLLLLKDLAVAEAWLHLNGYSSQTLLDYLNVLHLNRHESWGTAALPLQALGIPAKALEDPRVLDRRNETLSKSILFIVGHELGHVAKGLCAKTKGERCDYAALRQSESDADQFAATLLGRIGLVPQAAGFLYTIFSRVLYHQTEFATVTDWERHASKQDHPLDSQRIKALAQWMEANATRLVNGARVSGLVEELNKLATSLDDRDADLWQLACARSLELADLQPRTTLMATLRPTAVEANLRGLLAGYYQGEIRFHTNETRALEVLLVPSNDGRGLRAQTMFGGIRGSGQLSSDNKRHSADGTWIVGSDRYALTLEASKQNSANARYALLTDPRASGTWTLRRATPTQLSTPHDTAQADAAPSVSTPERAEPGGRTAGMVSTGQSQRPAGSTQDNASASEQRRPGFGTRALQVLGALAAAASSALTRHVTVNGISLNDQQLAEVDALNCGDTVPDGNYWLHAQSRTWGYVGERYGRPLPNCSSVGAPSQGTAQQPVQASTEDECGGYKYSEDRIECLRLKLMR